MIKTKLDRLLIVDLEATCFNDKTKPTEIIEIGVAPIDLETLDVREDICYASLVINKKTHISDFCTDLTGITQEMIDKDGKDFSVVCAEIEKYYSKKYPWGSWGNYDLNKMNIQCSQYGIQVPFGSTHYNIKNLFSLLTGNRNEFGLEKALKQRKMSFKGRQHSALDDAINSAYVLRDVLIELGLNKKGKR